MPKELHLESSSSGKPQIEKIGESFPNMFESVDNKYFHLHSENMSISMKISKIWSSLLTITAKCPKEGSRLSSTPCSSCTSSKGQSNPSSNPTRSRNQAWNSLLLNPKNVRNLIFHFLSISLLNPLKILSSQTISILQINMQIRSR